MAADVQGYHLFEMIRTYTCIDPYNYRKNKGQVQCSKAPQRGKIYTVCAWYTSKMNEYK